MIVVDCFSLKTHRFHWSSMLQCDRIREMVMMMLNDGWIICVYIYKFICCFFLLSTKNVRDLGLFGSYEHLVRGSMVCMCLQKDQI